MIINEYEEMRMRVGFLWISSFHKIHYRIVIYVGISTWSVLEFYLPKVIFLLLFKGFLKKNIISRKTQEFLKIRYKKKHGYDFFYWFFLDKLEKLK